MGKSKFFAWIEIAAGVSVFIGLLFVAAELRQSNKHASAESIQWNYQAWAEINQYESQYQIDLLVDKAAHQPDQLTDADLFRLDDYYTMLISTHMIRELMSDLGLTSAEEIDGVVERFVAESFFYSVARTWLQANYHWIDPETPELGRALRDAVEKTRDVGRSSFLESWRKDIARETGG